MGVKEKTIRSIKWNTIATIVCMVIGVLQIAILTRLLDKSDFGLIAIATMVISFTDIFAELGVTAALIHKQNITKEEYSSVYWLNIAVSLIICILTFLLAPAVSVFYKEPSLTLIIRLLSLRIIISAFGKIFQTIKTKNLEFDFISKVRIITSVVGLVASICLAYYGYGVMSLVYGQLIQIIINQGIYAFAGLMQMRLLFHFSFAEVKEVLTIGGYQLGSQVLDFVAARLDVFLIGRYFPMEQLGVYNIAKELIVKPFTIVNSITSNVFSSAFAIIQNDLKSVIYNYTRLIRTISLLTVPLYSLLFIFSDLIVSILYAQSFADVAVFLRIMALMGICSSLTSQGAAVMIAMGKTDLGLRWTIVRILMATLFLLITASISLYAVAYGQTIMALLSLIIYFILVIKPIFNDMSVRQYFSVFTGIIIGVVIITIPFACLEQYYEFSFLHQLLLGVLYVLLYYFFVRRFYNSNYKEIVRTIFPQKT